jgi:hypothetical protein
MNTRFLTRADAASWLQNHLGIPVSVHAMAHFAAKGNGPPYCRIEGRATLYSMADLEKWVEERIAQNVTRKVSKALGRPKGGHNRVMPNQRPAHQTPEQIEA